MTLEMTIQHWDFKSGGGYRYVHKADRGTFGFNGVFHKVRDNEFIIQTFEFEGAPDMVNIEYLWFEDLGDGRSRLRGRSICRTSRPATPCCHRAWKGGMTEGYREARRATEEHVMDWHKQRAIPADLGVGAAGIAGPAN